MAIIQVKRAETYLVYDPSTEIIGEISFYEPRKQYLFKAKRKQWLSEVDLTGIRSEVAKLNATLR